MTLGYLSLKDQKARVRSHVYGPARPDGMGGPYVDTGKQIDKYEFDTPFGPINPDSRRFTGPDDIAGRDAREKEEKKKAAEEMEKKMNEQQDKESSSEENEKKSEHTEDSMSDYMGNTSVEEKPANKKNKALLQ